VITRYVQKLDFARDSVFGIYDQDFRLVGVGHLAFLPREAIAVLREASEKQQVAELGVSVLPEVRGEGIGTRLFVRAAIHCRNRDVDTLHMKCLARNEAMMHLARKAGMEIHVGCGEANAYLKLRLADPLSVLREAIEEQYAALDYTRQSNFHRPRRRCRALPGEPE
ncbi:MAG TPA: GNAT family N-acetyltransferase, partial [Noviherbaspirillum sp.]|nr:GNAT family N-acetyltransferase [Noviherbaspirillum sp.]